MVGLWRCTERGRIGAQARFGWVGKRRAALLVLRWRVEMKNLVRRKADLTRRQGEEKRRDETRQDEMEARDWIDEKDDGRAGKWKKMQRSGRRQPAGMSHVSEDESAGTGFFFLAGDIKVGQVRPVGQHRRETQRVLQREKVLKQAGQRTGRGRAEAGGNWSLERVGREDQEVPVPSVVLC
jgi:hypothetical protein